MKISFAGHAHLYLSEKVKEIVKKQIRNQITDEENIVCYLGGYGDFDKLCACACRELKKELPQIEVVLVVPYMNLSEQAKMKEQLRCGLYDTLLYPPIEHIPPKFAISKRNEWMMTNADLIIVYINHSYGGAYKSFQIAKRQKKNIINICDFIK